MEINKSQTHTSLMVMLSTANLFMQKRSDLITYRQFTPVHTGNCMHIEQDSGSLLYTILKINYTFQNDYESTDVETRNIVIAKSFSTSVEYFHYMITKNADTKEDEVRVGSFTRAGLDLIEIPLSNMPFRDSLFHVQAMVSCNIGEDHRVVDYIDVYRPIINDEHMKKMFELEPFHSINVLPILEEFK